MNFLKRLWQAVTSKKAQSIIQEGVNMVNEAEPLIRVFADVSGNTTLQSVVAGYEKYGLPVTQALADGKLTPAEIKALAGLGVQTVLEQTKGSTGTAAALANVLAFTNVKYGG